MSAQKGKIEKERRQLKGFARVISKRTKKLDQVIQKYVKSDENKFYKIEDYRSQLNEFVESLRVIIDKNAKIGESFKEVENEMKKVSEMSSFVEHLDEIEVMVD